MDFTSTSAAVGGPTPKARCCRRWEPLYLGHHLLAAPVSKEVRTPFRSWVRSGRLTGTMTTFATAIRAEAGRQTASQARRLVRISHLVLAYTTEHPPPTMPQLAARVGASVETIRRDMASVEFLDEFGAALDQLVMASVQEGLALHVQAMQDATQPMTTRLAAARWLWDRWRDARRALARTRGGEVAVVENTQTEEELLRQLVAETKAARDAVPPLD